MYLNKETGEYPLNISQIQERHPLTMMAHNLECYALVEPSDMPAHNADTHKPVEIEPVEIDDVWRQQWSVVPLSAEELQAVAAAKARSEQEARDAARVRVTKRQALLALFDLKGIKEDAILAAIDAIPDHDARYRALVDWRAESIENDSQTVLQLADALGISADLPGLFAYAKTL
jgi:hypothetical protein